MLTALEPKRAPKPRSERREPLVLRVGLRRSGCRMVAVELRDLSTQGFRAETFDRVQPGERVWLTLPGLEGLCARVAWTRDDQIGCEFVSPLHSAVLNILLAKVRASGMLPR